MSASISDDQAAALVELVRTKIRHALGLPRRSDDDRSDVEQDVLVAVLSKLQLFDPTKATLTTFIARMTEHALVSRLRRMLADKRNPIRHPYERRRETPFRPEAVADRDHSRCRDLAIDLKEAIQQLAPDLEQLARDLQQWTADELAERQGVHRGTIYRRIARLRDRWQDSSLKDYLEP